MPCAIYDVYDMIMDRDMK